MKTGLQPIFKFRKHASIGAPDAESDADFLDDCFVDTGDLSVLLDTACPKRVVVGRTGAGKSALLKELLKREQHAIELSPENLALNHVANSNVIQFFEGAGVNLNSFYQLLWKHVLAVELLKMRFGLGGSTRPLWDQLKDKISFSSAKKKAIDYVEQWAPNFWLESESRIKEITQKFEESANADFKGKFDVVEIGAGGSRSLTEDVKSEVISRGQKVVNQLQLQELSELIRLLADEIFSDDQQKHFIVIDTLDENWVDDRIKLKLIRALLEVVRSFQKIKNVKIVIALRIDLLRRVFNRTRDAGFQEEKFDGLCLDVTWTTNHLRELIETRINNLIKRQYSSAAVKIEDMFPNKVSGVPAFDYIVSRTLHRPRDAISFVNECLLLVEGRTAVSSSIIKQAEAGYSKSRLTSLADEWIGDYPQLLIYTKLLDTRTSRFKLSDFSQSAIEGYIIEICTELPEGDLVNRMGQEVFDGKRSINAFVCEIVRLLYSVGMIGIKPDGYSQYQWAFDAHASLSDAQIKASASIEIHAAYWRALGIRPI